MIRRKIERHLKSKTQSYRHKSVDAKRLLKIHERNEKNTRLAVTMNVLKKKRHPSIHYYTNQKIDAQLWEL